MNCPTVSTTETRIGSIDHEMTTLRSQITGDLFRPADGGSGPVAHQSMNIRWLHSLIAGPVAAALGTTPMLICDHHGFDFDAAWSALGLAPTQENWARLYEGGPESDAAVALLAPLFDTDIVIAFEPSPLVERAVACTGGKLIAVSIHPYRFAHDLFFGLRTADPAMHDALSRLASRGESLELDAAVIRARCARGPDNGEHGRSLVLLLQDTFDATMIEDGAFWTQDLLFDQAAGFIDGFDDVLVRPRPHRPAVPEHMLRRLAHHLDRDVRATTAHAYRLMADPVIGAFAAVSSGALDEAAFFRRRTFRTARRRHNLAPWGDAASSTPDSVLLVDSHLLLPKFWHTVLACLTTKYGPGIKGLDPVITPRPVLRESLGEDWGFNSLSVDAGSHWICPMPEPTLSPGETLNFGIGSSALQWLRGSWHEPEAEHIWSMVPEVYLVIPVEIKDYDESTLHLSLAGWALSLPGSSNRIFISLMNNILVSTSASLDGSFYVDLPITKLDMKGQNILSFSISVEHATAPRFQKIQTDSRRLGIALRYVSLLIKASNSET